MESEITQLKNEIEQLKKEKEQMKKKIETTDNNDSDEEYASIDLSNINKPAC